MGTKAAAFILTLLVTAVLFTSSPSASDWTLPDDPLYQAKISTEEAKLRAAVDPLEKAALHTEFAGNRLAELQEIGTTKPGLARGLADRYGASVRAAMDEAELAQSLGMDAGSALERVEAATMKHTEVLAGLLEKVPAEARPAIEHAMEVSRTGRDHALGALERIRASEPARPERIEKPVRIERPERPAGLPSGAIERPSIPARPGRP
ncbi:MAG: DUF5667 domain-containing protein [Thermodesulfobacteriota bacterium]|nr:MAG: DUF5667 domain-containing protein [Thermodesulfobacteriota bacterium]